jgi:hypothetical protein
MATQGATREAGRQRLARDWEALYRAYGRQPAAYLESEPYPFDAEEAEMEGCDHGWAVKASFVRDGAW